MMSQIQASDQWGYYQAKSIKAAVLETKMSLATTLKSTILIQTAPRRPSMKKKRPR